jgi:Mrp family chromosome partitioning ATPase
MEPVLGSIPECKHRNDGILGARLEPAVTEAARALYARLLIADGQKARRCILIASAMPGEGKSFTARVLARAAAESGRRVLIIESNFRRVDSPAPTKDSAPSGLAGILRGEIEPQEAIRQTSVAGVDLISAGSLSGNPALLLIDGKFAKLMRWAEQYDLVLLDGCDSSLPGLSILGRHSDGVLWCVRWGHTTQSDVKSAADDLRKQRIDLLGFVLTIVNLRELRYFERPPILSGSQSETL